MNSRVNLSRGGSASSSEESKQNRRTSMAIAGQMMMGHNKNLNHANAVTFQIPNCKDVVANDSEEFFFGSPQKQQVYQQELDALTQDSTPDKYEFRVPGAKGENDDFFSAPFDNEELTIVKNKPPSLKPITKQKSDDVSQLDNLFSNSMIRVKKQQSSSENFKHPQDKYRLIRDLNASFGDLEYKQVDEENEGEDSQAKDKFDFESQKGYDLCKGILKLVEKLFHAYGLRKNDRTYRRKFSKAYDILYEQNGGQDELCYLNEILDSAQENYPHLWVNGEKYVFSDEVTQAGVDLYEKFTKIKDCVANVIDSPFGDQLEQQKQLMFNLAAFDQCWTRYEQFYVYELMVIERDARRFIIEAIGIEQELSELEQGGNRGSPLLRSDPRYQSKREELILKMAQINTVTNMNGKGRDDLTDIKILEAAENIPNLLLVGQANSVQVLADKIRETVTCFRMLVKKYSENLDAVDPQLRNNQELVQIMEIYEGSWSQGKEHLQDSCNRDQLINFCLHLDNLTQQYPFFKEQVDSSEAEIFLSIPSLIVLRGVANEHDSHSHQQLSKRFCESIEFSDLQREYDALQGDRVEISRQLEEYLIHDDESKIVQAKNRQEIVNFGQKVKTLGMELSRSNAQEFNSFITAALGE